MNLMKPCFAAVVVSLALACSACSSRPEIRLDRTPGVAFSQYQTFAFAGERAALESARYVTLLEGEVRSSTRAELERRNYVYSERNPDLLVAVDLGNALSIDVRDAHGDRSVWQGTAEGRSLQHTIERYFPASMDEVVGEMFAGFPLNTNGGNLQSESRPN
jgi:hypothetical protein